MHSREQAVLTVDGYQEVRVTINRRYHPDTVRVQQGVPVWVRFLRGEDDPCSERVIFSAFGVDRRLPAFQETTVEFVPTETGVFLFTCQWGMYSGKLVVMASRGEPRFPRAIKLKESMAEAKEGTSSQARELRDDGHVGVFAKLLGLDSLRGDVSVHDARPRPR